MLFMRRSMRFFALALVQSILFGCAGGTMVRPVTLTGSYTPQILSYAGGKGGMPVAVVGNPFNAPQEDVDAAVAAALERSHFGPRIPFLTQAPEGFTSPYRVVVALDPAPGAGARSLCAGRVETRPRAPAGLNRVEAALCARELVITSTGGRVAGPLGPRDPAFVALIERIGHALFPPFDPDRHDGNDDFF